MRGREQKSEGLFSYVRLEERIARDHPLRAIRALTDEVLALMNASFEAIYSDNGRPSIPPELLLRATLLQAFFSVRSERQLMDQIDYNLLFRWFVGLRIDDKVWHATVFTKNRDRLLETQVAKEFLSKLMALKQVRRLLSHEHFSVDGTLIERDACREGPPAGKEKVFAGAVKILDPPANAKIGFIGIGNMGFPMAGHLVKAGWDVQVYDIDRAKVERFVAEHGGKAAQSPEEVGRNANVIITIVLDGHIVERVTGKPLDVALDELVLKPLKMTQTRWVVRGADVGRIARAQAGSHS